MSNYFLKTDHKIAVVSALAEGSSIRSVERMTGIHRDTIMRLGVRIGQGCVRLLDEKMRGLEYSQPRIKASEKIWIMGTPDPKAVSTSYVERKFWSYGDLVEAAI